MRTPSILFAACAVALTLSCSDGSPTAPEQTSAERGSVTGGDAAPVVLPGGRTHNTGVIAPRGGAPLRPGVYVSDQAVLLVTAAGAKLEISGGNFPMGTCFGKFGDITFRGIPDTRFELGGIYTQLLGVYPGKAEYPAEFTGSIQGNFVTIVVTVPALQQSFGPYVLKLGSNPGWTPCLYP